MESRQRLDTHEERGRSDQDRLAEQTDTGDSSGSTSSRAERARERANRDDASSTSGPTSSTSARGERARRHAEQSRENGGPGPMEHYIAGAEADRDVIDDLTRGGLLSETRNSNDGLVPGEAGWVNLSEQGLRSAAEDIDGVKDSFDENPDVTIAGSDVPERVLQGAAGAGVDLLNFPQHAVTLETGVEVATNAPGEIQEHGAGEVAETATAVGTAIGGAMAREATSNPVEFASGTAFGFVTGAALGRAAGKVGRLGKDRIRTAGGDYVDTRDLAQEDVVRYTETDGAEGEQFPGAKDPDTYESDPPQAVQEQADEFTPQEVAGFFDEQGVTEGSVMKKALDVEPDGPGKGRSDTGFTSAPDEVDGDFEYETPGSFFGPELSPNFLRVGGGESSFSARPGLPDFGNNPTGVLARTDVENPDADTLEGFNQEMLDRSGETTAVTKPSGDVNTDEIEAVVPPGAEFAPVRSGGGLTGAARRLGIGSDFYTEVGGRRVPLRTVAPKDKTPDTDGALPGDSGGSGESLSYYVESPEQPVDRPLPTFYTGTESAAAGGAAAGQQGPGTYDGPVDDMGGFGSSPYDSPVDESGGFGSGPIDETGGYGNGPYDRPGDTSSPPSSPPSSGPSPGFDEYGPTSPPPSSPPSSAPPSGGPSSPPTSSPPSSPPGSPPPWSPPGSYDGGSQPPSSPPGSGGPGGSGGGFGPSPFDPGTQRRRDFDDDDRRRDDEERRFPAFGAYDVDYQNPIASGAQVLFGGFGGGFGTAGGAVDETGGLQEANGGAPIDEASGFGSFGAPVDETGGLSSFGGAVDEDLENWTPF